MGAGVGRWKECRNRGSQLVSQINMVRDLTCAREVFGCFPPPAMGKTFGVLGAQLDSCRKASLMLTHGAFRKLWWMPRWVFCCVDCGWCWGDNISALPSPPSPPAQSWSCPCSSPDLVSVSSWSLCDVNFKSRDTNSLPGGGMCAITWLGGW